MFKANAILLWKNILILMLRRTVLAASTNAQLHETVYNYQNLNLCYLGAKQFYISPSVFLDKMEHIKRHL